MREHHTTMTTPHAPANRVFVLGSDGKPLAPCRIQRARQLIKEGRVRKRGYRHGLLNIQLKDRDRTNAKPADLTVRSTPGVRTTGIAVVMTTPTEERVVYQEEITHRADISRRLQERATHRRRRRGTKWYRKPRFDNRRRPESWTPPTVDSIVSNQEHRIRRLARHSGAETVTVQTGKFDTQKILNPGIRGKEYQQGPLYETHLRAYIAEQWKHRCAYCGLGSWENRTRFNLDHVVPRSAGGPTNVRNLVWSCEPCNRKKGSTPVTEFLKDKPATLAGIEATRPTPLAATGVYAWICQEIVRRLQSAALHVQETTGADTAATRKRLEVPKTPANDAACCTAKNPITELRAPIRLRAVGHGRRKQIKGLPTARYTAWRHLPPGERRRTPCPGHAVHPNNVAGIRSGDVVQVFSRHKWLTGRAQVKASTQQVKITRKEGAHSTRKRSRMRRIAPRDGYVKSN